MPLDDPDGWRASALCAQTDPELWFPDRELGVDTSRTAKKICADCPVQFDCLEDALAHNEKFGIWGGMSREERRAEQRRRNRIWSA